METATASFRSCLSSGFRSPNIRLGVTRSNFLRFESTSVSLAPTIKLGDGLGQRRMSLNNRRCSAIRASLSSSDSGNSSVPIAPLHLESPVGQFLAQILVSHPHLVPAAVEQQLEQLQSDRDAEKQKEGDLSTSGTDLVLYRRIAEVKASERRKALEEILYALVIQKFMDANVLLVPSLASSTSSDSDPSGRVDTWNTEVENLEKLHSSEAYEMIQNHLSLILGNRLGDSNSVAEISKLRVGQVYAASIMYGYFLKRVDQRFRLEQTMRILPEGFGDEETTSIQQTVDQPRQVIGDGDATSQRIQTHSDGGDIRPGGFDYATKSSSRLRTYVMSFDIETLQRYATIRSKEAVTIVEKHTEALFGRPEIVVTPMGTIDSSKEELIKISCGGLRRLVLEAVTFGAILWDVESFVDSRYHFVAS